MSTKKCAGCGNPVRKTVRALILKSDTAPRMGLVCKVCASCGTLVVPATLRMLPAKPKKVAKARAMPKLLADAELVRQSFVDRLKEAIDEATPEQREALARIALGTFEEGAGPPDEWFDPSYPSRKIGDVIGRRFPKTDDT